MTDRKSAGALVSSEVADWFVLSSATLSSRSPPPSALYAWGLSSHRILHNTNMSLARSTRFTYTLAAAGARRPAPALPLAAVLARRALSTSLRRSDRGPIGSTSTRPTENDPDYFNKGRLGNKGPPLGSGVATAGDEPGKIPFSYENGPGALDKAVHLFFFTEILRGASYDTSL